MSRIRPSNRSPGGTGRCLLLILFLSARAAAADPFIDEVVSFEPGTGAGFGANRFPQIVLGPPVGTGLMEGSLDVLSLGNGGRIVVAFRDNAICDAPGPDFIIFENAFRAGGENGVIFVEVGIVAVSEDGENFVELAYDVDTFVGLAGRSPVLSNPENGIDPTDPSVAGGDAFDISETGLNRVAFIRITDPGATIRDPGSVVPSVDQAGFDLDAIAAVNHCDSTSTSPTVTSTPTADDSVPTATETATPSPQASSPSPTPDTGDGDLNGDGEIDERDAFHCIAELFDGDGDQVAAAGGGNVVSPPGVDVNDDGRVTAADVTAVLHRVPD